MAVGSLDTGALRKGFEISSITFVPVVDSGCWGRGTRCVY